MSGVQASSRLTLEHWMKRRSCFFALAVLGSLQAQAASAQEAVSLLRQDHKALQVAAYSPGSSGCRGVALISPGAGGSENGYQYLGEAMSTLGYLAVVVGHQESGRRALRQQLRDRGLRDGLSALITDPNAYRGRFMDLAAARKWAASRCRAAETVLIGHSMGAATAMIEAGARNQLGLKGADSFRAYIALSPQGIGSIFPQNAWSDIRSPVMLLTGTRDDELGGASWRSRTEPYRNMPAGCKWLAVIDGATHMNFAGRGMSRQAELLTTQMIGSFLAGIQRGDCRAPRQIPGLAVQSK